MLLVKCPNNNWAERQYIYSLVLQEFLGQGVSVAPHDLPTVQITNTDDSSHLELNVDDTFFALAADKWLHPSTLPISPLALRQLPEILDSAPSSSNTLPILYGKTPSQSELVTQQHKTLTIHLDVFGSAFFALTRYEEFVLPDRDVYDRFPARASVFVKEDLIQRPIINEYIEILWSYLKFLWPSLERRRRNFRFLLSHDVDWPYFSIGTNAVELLRAIGGDLVVRKDPDLAWRRWSSYNDVRSGQLERDVYNNFGLIFDLAERLNIRSTFNFISAHTAGRIDGTYSLDDPNIKRLMLEIHSRGHEIGLHPSFNTYLNRDALKSEFSTLRDACARLGIYQQEWGGRQHFLRWRNSTTWQNWEAVGLSYDSTLGYSDRIGFRAGIAHEYSAFDLAERKPLRIKERPLIVMDMSAIDSYEGMGLSYDQAIESICRLASVCHRYDGDFTLLWHNNFLAQSKQKRCFKDLVSRLTFQRWI